MKKVVGPNENPRVVLNSDLSGFSPIFDKDNRGSKVALDRGTFPLVNRIQNWSTLKFHCRRTDGTTSKLQEIRFEVIEQGGFWSSSIRNVHVDGVGPRPAA